MYLRGSKWSYRKRRKSVDPWRVIILVILVAGAVYINQVVVPITPPLFIATPTVTRAPESFITDAQKLEEQGRISQAILAYQDAVQAYIQLSAS